jgi:tetratricopeptide (TPR) repeat protein
MLMVLDNACTEAQVRPLLPGAGGSLVLVTSRSVLPGLEADERISLDILPADEAAAMLARVIRARAEADPQAVAEVARLCGRLPLALRIAGQLLAAHPRWQVGRLVQLLADEQDRLTQLGAGDLQVRAAFEVSYAQLAQEDARLFRLLGLHPGPDFTAGSAAALAGVRAEATGPVLDRLAGAYLVTEDTAGRFSMHDLLRVFARSTCQDTDTPADREAAETRVVSYYADLAESLDSCVNPQLRPAAEQAAQQDGRLLPSMREALVVFQAERPGLLAALGLADRHRWDQQVWQLSNGMGDVLSVLHYPNDLLTARETALTAARRIGDTRVEGCALNNLGIAYRELRRFEEAVDCFQQDITICQETGDRGGEGQTLNNLGEVYREQERFEEAIDCYQEALAILREAGDRYVEGQALNNVGIAYRRLRRFDEAVDCYQQALTICRETGDRRGEGQTLSNLGNTYRDLRRFEEAITCHQQAVAICQETGDRYHEGIFLHNLGGDLQRLQRFAEAVDCHQQALAVVGEADDRYGEGAILANLGSVYQELRQSARAAKYWREAAAAMRDAGDHEEAERLEQLVAGTQSRPRRWGLRRRPSS